MRVFEYDVLAVQTINKFDIYAFSARKGTEIAFQLPHFTAPTILVNTHVKTEIFQRQAFFRAIERFPVETVYAKQHTCLFVCLFVANKL